MIIKFALSHNGWKVNAARWDGHSDDFDDMRDFVGLVFDEAEEEITCGIRASSSVESAVEAYGYFGTSEPHWKTIPPGSWVALTGWGDVLTVDAAELNEVDPNRFCPADRLDCPEARPNHYHCGTCGEITGMQGHHVGGPGGRVICDDDEREAYLTSVRKGA